MEQLEEQLRERFRLLSPTGTDSVTMLGRLRRRRVRRQAFLAGLLTVLVLMTAGTVTIVRGRMAAPQPAAAAATLSRHGVPQFYDAEHGFVLAVDCPLQQCVGTECPCALRMVATTDGGQTWQPRAPFRQLTDRDGAWFWMFDRNHLVVEAMSSSVRLVSDDAGVTWREVPSEVQGTVTEAAPRSLVRATPAGLYVTGPDGLTRHMGQPLPAQDTLSGSVLTATDGSYWTVIDPKSRTLELTSISRDNGMTWHTVPNPPSRSLRAGDSVIHEAGLVTSDGKTLYWVADEYVWRSTNDGQQWLPVTVPSFGKDVKELLPMARRDGGIQLYDLTTGAVYVAGPADSAFAPAAPKEVTGAVPMWGARYLRISPDRVVSHSADGITWTELRLN